MVVNVEVRTNVTLASGTVTLIREVNSFVLSQAHCDCASEARDLLRGRLVLRVTYAVEVTVAPMTV